MNQNKELQLQFYKLKTRQDVSKILGIKDRSLRYFLYGVGTENLYHEIEIKKRNGGIRKICAPEDKLKNIQRKMLHILEEVYRKKPAAYGFINDKSNVSNAQNHCKRELILNIDLKDFFDQIHFGRVFGLLKKEPYSIGEEAAKVIAQLVCYKGKLPQGAPTSPIISNMICSPLDTQLTQLAKRYKLVYTRYADDITFSTHRNKFPIEIVDIVENKIELGSSLKEILKKNSFIVNDEKIHLKSKYERQEVTGLIVNRFANLKKEYIREIRAILHNCKNDGIYITAQKYVDNGLCNNKYIKKIIYDSDEKKKMEVVSWFEKVLKGKIEYIKNVRGEENSYYLKYALQANEIFEKEIFDVDRQVEFKENLKSYCFIIENREGSNQGSGFLLKDYGVLTNYHVIKGDDFYSVHTCENVVKGTIGREMNLVCEDEKIDYSLFFIMKDTGEGLELEENGDIKIGMKVKLAGFPIYNKGDSIYFENCEVTSKKKSLHGEDLYTVSGRIVHGASGGVVLNEDYKVIGIIECGSNSFDEGKSEEIIPGFIPISNVIKHIEKMG